MNKDKKSYVNKFDIALYSVVAGIFMGMVVGYVSGLEVSENIYIDHIEKQSDFIQQQNKLVESLENEVVDICLSGSFKDCDKAIEGLQERLTNSGYVEAEKEIGYVREKVFYASFSNL